MSAPESPPRILQSTRSVLEQTETFGFLQAIRKFRNSQGEVRSSKRHPGQCSTRAGIHALYGG